VEASYKPHRQCGTKGKIFLIGEKMGFNISFFVYAFTSLFIIMNPIGLVPLFYLWTSNNTEKEKITLLKKAVIVVIITLVVFAFFGKLIFGFFGITIDSFKVAGGILILKIAWDMLHAKVSRTRQTPTEKEEMVQLDDIAVVPLAIPLLAGPGTITTSIILMEHSTTIYDKLTILISIVLAALISAGILYMSDNIANILKTSGIKAIVRLMGLILSAIAIEIISSGIFGLVRSSGLV
jgi:multiple antibiotic resistance protein